MRTRSRRCASAMRCRVLGDRIDRGDDVIGTAARSIASRCQCAIAPQPTIAVRSRSVMRPPRRRGTGRSSSRSGRAPRRGRARSRRGGRTASRPCLPARVLGHERVEPAPRVVGHRQPGPVVDALDHADVVGHELVEDHVDAAIGGQEVAVAHARSQQPVDAVDPVLGERFGLDRGAAHAVAVREHRRRRLDHRHRVAVRDRERRVGKGREQRRDLFEVLRRLQHPAVRAAQERERPAAPSSCTRSARCWSSSR